MLPDGKGNVYLGTGDGGVIYKMDAAGKVSPFFQTKELEVTSLALDECGQSCMQELRRNGIVFKIAPDGKGEKRSRRRKSTSRHWLTNSHSIRLLSQLAAAQAAFIAWTRRSVVS